MEYQNPFVYELNMFHQVSQIPLCIFDNTPKMLSCYTYDETITCSKEILNHCCLALKKQEDEEAFPVLYTSDGFLFGLVKMDEQVNVMVGPVASASMSYREFYDKYYKICATEDFIYLYRLLQQSPCFALEQFAHSLCLFVYMVFQKKIPYERVLDKQVRMPEVGTSTLKKRDVKGYYLTLAEALAFQKQVGFLIQLGDAKGIEKKFQQTMLFEGLDESPFVMEDLKRIFFVYAVGCCEMVLEEGVDIKKAFAIFDLYKPKMLNLAEPGEFGALCKQISLDYCQEICLLKRDKTASPIVNKCLQYIYDNKNNKITVTDLAVHCGISSRSVSRHFKEYLHISVSDFILQQKLEKAVFLLENSDLPLAEISNQLAFSSQSHFTVAFKKRYLITPQKYKEKFGKRR